MAHKFEEKRKSILQQMDMNLECVLNIFSWNRLELNLKSGYFNQLNNLDIIYYYFSVLTVHRSLHESMKMKAGKIFLLLLCLNVITIGVIANPPTCDANLVIRVNGKGILSWIPRIKYEGPSSKNPLAYKWYNKEEEILGKKMKDWMRFSVAFWHTFRGSGSDPFGAPTKYWPWEDGTNSVAMAKRRSKIDLYLFNFVYLESNANLDEVVALAKELQGTKIRPLWGTAQLFMHPRYMHGGATSSELGVYVYSAAQVKKAMEVTHYLGGENYVFWGGREGYQTLLNTDMGRELDHMARFFESAAAYKKKIGFSGTLLIEPKPQEPTKHQYDWDAATAANFLRKYGLEGEFKLNIECNHATLSGHSCHHELETARLNGMLGNIDANTGDPQIGWDTDQFLTDIGEATLVMLSVVRNGGLAPGGFNFDAKLRRESTDVEDLFIAHISGMDTLARGLRNVAKLIEDGSLAELVRKRYQSFDSELGAQIEVKYSITNTTTPPPLRQILICLRRKPLNWENPKLLLPSRNLRR
ncbi:xylose isomerase [Quercus suber]|uniref:Xylose isomerase n=1 Tax=Quercus suber TaxID=58331 RepID=A0AAW0L8N2_QUESU